MLITLLVAVFILILGLELPTLIRQKLYKEIAVFAIVYTVGVIMALINFYNLPVFNPFEALAVFLSNHYGG